MDILENNIYNNINGYTISENTYLNNSKIYKVYTDEFGLISIYTKNTEMYLSLYSNYNFKLTYRNEFFYCNEYELTELLVFKTKEQILFLNVITEIILKTNVSELKNIDVYNLIEEVLQINNIDYKILLTYFIIKYLLYNGYHIIFDSDENIQNFNFDISELIINSSFNSNNRINHVLNKSECDYIYLLNCLDSIKNFDAKNINVNYSRILGIIINAMCLNFNIYKLNSFNLR